MHRLLVLLIAIAAATTVLAEDPSEWTTQLPPFRIADNLYYVGSRDLAAYLVTTPDGNILINANLASSPPQIRASVEKLGFRWADTMILLNSQAHFDHVGGAAEVLRETKARDYVMTGDDAAMRSGGRDDFSHDIEQLRTYTPVAVDRVLQDGDKVTLGGVTLTAHRTAGHTRGCTTWTMEVHGPGEPAGKLRHVVIVGGWAPLPHYQLVDAPGHPTSYPASPTTSARRSLRCTRCPAISSWALTACTSTCFPSCSECLRKARQSSLTQLVIKRRSMRPRPTSRPCTPSNSPLTRTKTRVSRKSPRLRARLHRLLKNPGSECFRNSVA